MEAFVLASSLWRKLILKPILLCTVLSFTLCFLLSSICTLIASIFISICVPSIVYCDIFTHVVASLKFQILFQKACAVFHTCCKLVQDLLFLFACSPCHNVLCIRTQRLCAPMVTGQMIYKERTLTQNLQQPVLGAHPVSLATNPRSQTAVGISQPWKPDSRK